MDIIYSHNVCLYVFPFQVDSHLICSIPGEHVSLPSIFFPLLMSRIAYSTISCCQRNSGESETRSLAFAAHLSHLQYICFLLS